MITFTNGSQKNCKVYEGFEVLRSDMLGKLLSAAAYGQSEQHILAQARRKWDEIECSSEPRYETLQPGGLQLAEVPA